MYFQRAELMGDLHVFRYTSLTQIKGPHIDYEGHYFVLTAQKRKSSVLLTQDTCYDCYQTAQWGTLVPWEGCSP